MEENKHNNSLDLTNSQHKTSLSTKRWVLKVTLVTQLISLYLLSTNNDNYIIMSLSLGVISGIVNIIGGLFTVGPYGKAFAWDFVLFTIIFCIIYFYILIGQVVLSH